jgi:uncharacterized protein with PIN domain
MGKPACTWKEDAEITRRTTMAEMTIPERAKMLADTLYQMERCHHERIIRRALLAEHKRAFQNGQRCSNCKDVVVPYMTALEREADCGK